LNYHLDFSKVIIPEVKLLETAYVLRYIISILGSGKVRHFVRKY